MSLISAKQFTDGFFKPQSTISSKTLQTLAKHNEVEYQLITSRRVVVNTADGLYTAPTIGVGHPTSFYFKGEDLVPIDDDMQSRIQQELYDELNQKLAFLGIPDWLTC